MATTDFQNSVYKTIDVIVSKRIEDLKLDKTIDGIIDSCIDQNQGKYRVKYGAGFFDAYSYTDEIYVPKTPVHVLVPENDFNKKKTIIGRASTGIVTTEDDSGSQVTEFDFIGDNLLILNNQSESFRLSAWQRPSSEIVLYDINSTNNALKINQDALEVYLEDMDGLYFSGDFANDYEIDQWMNGNANYYLSFYVTLKNGDTKYQNMNERWAEESELISVTINGIEKTLNSYKEDIDTIFENISNKTTKEIQKELNKKLTDIQTFSTHIDTTIIPSNEKGALELVDLFTTWINELVNFDQNVDGYPISAQELKNQYESWFTETFYTYDETTYLIKLDTSKMQGPIYYFTSYTPQSMAVSINPSTFVRVERICFGTENFTPIEKTEYDTFVRNIALKCIKYKESVSDSYTLNISYKDNKRYFNVTDSTDEEITIIANLLDENKIDVSENGRFFWFKKDSNITSADDAYNSYGGEGWYHLQEIDEKTGVYDRKNTLTVQAKDNKSYNNQYKVVALYDESSTPVTREFSIYNKKNKYNTRLVCDTGITFRKNAPENKIISYQIDGKDAANASYDFKWKVGRVSDDEQMFSIVNESEKTEDMPGYDLLQYITWYRPSDSTSEKYNITVSSKILDSENEHIYITCSASSDTIDFNEADITLGYKINNNINNRIEIVNGNQIFQYNEDGTSPVGDQTILPLKCNFYDTMGGLIDPLEYTVYWVIPTTNSLIQIDRTLVSQKDNSKVNADVCDFTIAEQYNYNYTNNQITCVVTYDTEVYSQSTNFFFGKVGNNGSNGTDIVATISVLSSDNRQQNERLLTEPLTLEINGDSKIWNNGSSQDDAILQFQLFNNGELIDSSEYKSISWFILNNGLSSEKFEIIPIEGQRNQVSIEYQGKEDTKYTNYIIQARASLSNEEETNQTYYAYYPICIKTAAEGKTTDYSVVIDKQKTLREVVYDASGRNPQYDKHLGVGLKFEGLTRPRTIIWKAYGGIINNGLVENTSSLSLGKNKTIVPVNGDVSTIEQDIKDQIAFQQKNYMSDIISMKEQYSDSLIEQIKNISADAKILDEQRTDIWNNFEGQIKDEIESIITSIPNIDNYIYNGNSHYENFSINLLNYINYILICISIDINKYFVAHLQVLPQKPVLTKDILKQLELKFDSSVGEAVQDEYKRLFKRLQYIATVGYQIELITYRRENKNLYSEIEELETQNNNLAKELTKYNDFTDEYANQFKQIIWEALFDDKYPEEVKKEEPTEEQDEVIQNLVGLLTEKYESELAYNKYLLSYTKNELTDSENPTFCSVIPNEMYSGEYPNQYVKALIYNQDICEYEIIIPIYMYLNKYDFAELNNWGDTEVVLSSQVNTGKKHLEDNTFTGFSAGVKETYTDGVMEEQVGLYGFNHGKQSILLDAETGDAIFGLPQVNAEDVSDALTKGTIELRPGGISNIAKWKFNSNSLYKVASDEETQLLETRYRRNNIADEALDIPYDDAPQYALSSIPHTKQGILLSSLPVYASFKGRPLTGDDQKNKKINYLNNNTTVREDDSFELQIDPNDSQFFSLYEHSSKPIFGEYICDTAKNFISNEWLSESEIRTFVGDEEYHETDYLICQMYYATSGTSVKLFRPLSLLSWDGKEDSLINSVWKCKNKAIINAHGKETEEYIIAECSNYKDYVNSIKDSVWKFIACSTPQNNISIVDCGLDDKDFTKIKILTLNKEQITDRIWRRHKKAGINDSGKFAAEAINVGDIGVEFGDIKAFGLESKFIGSNLSFKNSPIVQFFIDKQTLDTDRGPLYISSSKTDKDEGLRPIRLYATSSDSVPDNLKNYFGEDYYKSGIFVGADVEKNPKDNVSKLELWQGTGSRYLSLSALSGPEKKSIFKLSSSDEGILDHTNNWKTIIGGTLTKTVTGDWTQKAKSNFQLDITEGIRVTSKDENLIIDSGGKNTSNQLFVQHGNNNFILADNTKLINQNIIHINSGGAEFKPDGLAASAGVVVDAIKDSSNILLRAIGERASTITDEPTGLNPISGIATLRLQHVDGNTSNFTLTAGGPTGNSATIANNGGTVNIYQELAVGRSIGGGFHEGHIRGNGEYISNTANCYNENSRTEKGPTDDVTVSGYDGTGTIQIPYIKWSNGRPQFGQHELSIIMPSEQDLSSYLTKSEASNTYLTKSDASNTYLTKSDASDTYLTKPSFSDISGSPSFDDVIVDKDGKIASTFASWCLLIQTAINQLNN